MLRSLTFAAALAAAVLLTAGGAFAQAPQMDPRARGPYRGLFGGDPSSPQSLDLTLGLFGGYDDDVSGDPSTGGGGGGVNPGDPNLQASSDYYGGKARLLYRRNVVDRLSFRADGGVSTSYYRELDSLWATSYDAGAGLNWSINNRTRVNARQSFRFSPFYSYALFPVPGIPDPIETGPLPGFDTRVTRQDNYNYVTNVNFSRDTTRRSTFTADADFNYTDFRETADRSYQDSKTWGAGARWSYRLTQNASARVGYAYRTGNYAVLEGQDRIDNAIHNIDVGVDYSRALSFSRSTRFSFSTGTAAYRSVGNQVLDENQDFRFTFVGNARLSREIGQSWLAALTYQRDLQLVNGFSSPFLTDAVTASIGGYLDERTVVSFYSGVNWGDYGYGYSEPVDRRTRTIYVTPAIQYALTANLAAQASYFYYWYEFDEGALPLPPGFSPRNERQGFRVSLTTWIPLLR